MGPVDLALTHAYVRRSNNRSSKERQEELKVLLSFINPEAADKIFNKTEEVQSDTFLDDISKRSGIRKEKLEEEIKIVESKADIARKVSIEE